MIGKIALTLLWIGVGVYAFNFAPPDRPETFDLIQKLLVFDIEGINPLVVALFNIMGIWPLIYSGVLFADGRMQKVWAWPFATGSFAVGAFAILPYLILRQPNGDFAGKKGWVLKWFDSRWAGAIAALGAFALVVYGLTQGNWGDFAQQWQSDRFIHVMSLDFCLLCLLFPLLLRDDMARRGIQDQRIFWAVSLLPLLGSALYLVLRPPLEETAASLPQEQPASS